MSFTVRHGDMFSEPSDAYAHGVNIRGCMGGGVAAIVARKYPDLDEQYRRACADGELTTGEVLPIRTADGWVYNCASQCEPGPDARAEWLHDSLVAAMVHADGVGVRTIALPLIGGGIGGIEPDEARETIELAASSFPELDVTLWLWP